MPNPAQRGPGARIADKMLLLREHLLFRELPAPVIEHLAAYMKTRTVPRGKAIFAKGDPGTGLLGVLAGSVRISVASTDGRDVVLNIIQKGEIFGEIALLDGHPRTADATAVSDCELVTIERREFMQFLRSQPEVPLKLIEVLCARLRRTSEQVQDVTFLNLPTRLAKALLRMVPASNSSAREKKMTITQREISQIIGMSRESTNKQLREWEKRGWIRLERGGITVLAPDKLTEIAEEGLELDPS